MGIKLDEEHTIAIRRFFSGKNTTPVIKDAHVLIRGDFTNEVLQSIPIEKALEIVGYKVMPDGTIFKEKI